MEFQERLYQLRKQAGLSQEELAGLLGVTRQAVQKWESGASRPDMDNLQALAVQFSVTLDHLIAGREAAPPQPPTVVVENHYHRWQYEYKSQRTLFGLPLLHVCYGMGRPAVGIVAVGSAALGVVAMGGVACGLLCLGGIALGLLAALGGLALGGFCVGGAALGLIAWGGFAAGYLACGGIAWGVYSIGGIVSATKIAVGTIVSAPLAIGDECMGAAQFLPVDGTVSAAAIRAAIDQAAADAPRFVRDFLSFMAVHIHSVPLG